MIVCVRFNELLVVLKHGQLALYRKAGDKLSKHDNVHTETNLQRNLIVFPLVSTNNSTRLIGDGSF
jgi:hypothetical protein